MVSVSPTGAPRGRLVALFLALTVAPAVLLVAVGWLLYRQDRDAASREFAARREQAAELALTTLERAVVDMEQSLDAPETATAVAVADDAVVVSFAGTRSTAFPASRLLFDPSAPSGWETTDSAFDAAEDFERSAPAQAASAYRRLVSSRDHDLRAGALVRLARVQAAAGQLEEALSALSLASEVTGATVTGTPANLFARWARCRMLAGLGRNEELKVEANALRADLLSGKWRLDRPRFEMHLADATGWVQGTGPVAPAALALSRVVDELWRRERDTARMGAEESGRELIRMDDVPVTVLWRRRAGEFAAALLAESFVEREWLAPLGQTLENQGVLATLRDPADVSVADYETRRVAADTGLPWTVVVSHVDLSADLAGVESRRRLWLLGLLTLSVLVAAGGYVVTRALTRELATARLQRDFVAAVSHEFRTPLTSLRQVTEILLDERLVAESRRRTYYEALARQTDRLHRLVESLLDLGRMEAGRSPYRQESLDGCALVRAVVDDFRREVAARRYDVELTCPPDAVAVQGDRDALTNALWNLLDNAVKYSPEHRTIWVDAERGEADFIIKVRDLGLGIPPAEQQAIFDTFVRGARATSEGIRGTGIGLAMVRHIVMAHGGSVGVESEPGNGSTFTVRLPVPETV